MAFTETEIQDMIQQIRASMKLSLGTKWDEARIFAESEAKNFAFRIAEIGEWLAIGKINEEQAKVLIRMHERSMKMVLTALEGISLVMAEKVVNAAIDTVKNIASRLIGAHLFV